MIASDMRWAIFSALGARLQVSDPEIPCGGKLSNYLFYHNKPASNGLIKPHATMSFILRVIYGWCHIQLLPL